MPSTHPTNATSSRPRVSAGAGASARVDANTNGHAQGWGRAGTPPEIVDPVGIWTEDFYNAEHIQAFERALAYSDVLPTEHGGDASPMSPRSPQASLFGAPDEGNGSLGPGAGVEARERVEKLTATSDFAPIHQRVSRRSAYSASTQGWTYHLMRWPLLWFIFFIISMEFGAYVCTRQVVNVFEYILAYRSRRGKLREELRQAKSYEEWVAIAKRMDAELEFDEWKETDDDGYYDAALVRRVRRTLGRLRAAKDTRGLMDALSVCLRTNFAGTESVKMYSETFFGTKRLVEAHISEVVASMDFIRTAGDVTLEEKRAFFRAVNKNYGSSALCLSGGASFGYYHFGVIRAFLDADLLPRVITGTSAGGLVAALLCTRTNEELKVLLVPELADKITACEDSFRVWFKRWRQTGARFSSVSWAEKAMFFTRGSLTFKEAYERTGRALNVSVVPSDRHSPTILLNHLTAPNCIIWSAIIASAAVPGILNPVVLMAKDRNGQVRPHNLGGSRFKDGSLREDIPLGSLHTQFNCNFSIVSQTNPHIHLFFFAPRGAVGRPVAHRKGKGWRGGFILSALESYIKLDLSKHFKVIRDLDLLPQILQSDWSGVFLQRFSGDLTLTPRSTIKDWLHLLDDPDRSQLSRMLDVGRRVTWPALHMVSNRMRIERAVFRGRSEVRQAMHRERTSNDQATSAAAGTHTPMSQVPIESDADAGFASRTRRVKAAKAAQHAASMSAPDLVRRRRLAAAMAESDRRNRAYEGMPVRATTGGVGSRVPRVTSVPRVEVTDEAGVSSGVSTSQGAPPRYRMSSLSDAYRHVRSSSLSAFSPFRSRVSEEPGSMGGAGTTGTTGTTTTSDDAPVEAYTTQHSHSHPRRSQRSITRWFGGGGSESSSDSEGGNVGGGRYGGMGVLGNDEVVEGDEGDEGEGDGAEGMGSSDESPEGVGVFGGVEEDAVDDEEDDYELGERV